MRADQALPGNGIILFFRVDDFAKALTRARALVSQLEQEPDMNPATGTREFALRDPDGYYVTISALSETDETDENAPVMAAQRQVSRNRY
jgi:predicted enzyme related to lactoylglutathione lyase